MFRPNSITLQGHAHRLVTTFVRSPNATSTCISELSMSRCGSSRNWNSWRNQFQAYSTTSPRMSKTVPITYVEADGTEKEVQAEIGKNLLDVAHENNVELEGACGGELACSTCHLIFEQEIYDSLPEKDDEEDDMLDLAFEVTETSRLGCQVIVTENFAGMKVKIPDDGF